MRSCFLAGALALTAAAAAAQSWVEPARGTAERAALMNAVRPHAEATLGAPVEFVVGDLRVAGDLAFAMLTAQRPGGGAIDLYATPGYARGEFDPEMSDGTGVQALFRRSGAGWVVMHHAVGATDVWWAAPELCAGYRPVIADACGG